MTIKGSRDRTVDHEEFGKTLERIYRNEARWKKQQKKTERLRRQYFWNNGLDEEGNYDQTR